MRLPGSESFCRETMRLGKFTMRIDEPWDHPYNGCFPLQLEGRCTP